MRVNTGKNKEPQLTVSVAYVMEIANFLIAHGSTIANKVNETMTKGVQKLVDKISFINDFEATFLSSDLTECPIGLNTRIMNALVKFNPSIVK